MYVTSLEFENYRNLTRDVIYPQRDINVICGENAQGKTNLIECLWLFTGGRSFRGSKDNDLVRFGEKTARIKLCFYSSGREQTIELEIGGGKRRPVLNDVPKNSVSQIIGSFCAVVFSPDHLTLIKSGPEGRRNFIDAAICQIKPSYAVILSRYRRILSERNALLKEIPRHRELEDTLDIWDDRLSREGAIIAYERFSYVQELSVQAGKFYEGISRGREILSMKYRTNCGAESGMDKKEIASLTFEALRKRQNDDILCGYTTVGVHRDDLNVRIDGRETRLFGSQGQQRSAVLSLKLAEAYLLGEKKGEAPVILLDDVLSELDLSRQEYLLNRLDGMQVFITCCEPALNAVNVISVKNGTISAEAGASQPAAEDTRDLARE